MSEFRITWYEPTKRNILRVLFVEAGQAANAEAVARDYIERHYGLAHFVIAGVKLAEVVPAGRVVEAK